jgi:hypothetical protein
MVNSSLKYAKSIFPLKNINNIENLNYVYQRKIKIVVFTPPEIADKLTSAMASSGAGKIGNYTECSFRANGTGTFRGGKKTKPFIGKKENFEKADEQRLEMICSYDNLDEVINAMLRVHPYEEPAYEIYKIWSRHKIKNTNAAKITLKRSTGIKKVLSKINAGLDIHNLKGKINNVKIKKAVVNLSGKDYGLAFVPHETTPVLYITKNKKNSYIISLK